MAWPVYAFRTYFYYIALSWCRGPLNSSSSSCCECALMSCESLMRCLRAPPQLFIVRAGSIWGCSYAPCSHTSQYPGLLTTDRVIGCWWPWGRWSELWRINKSPPITAAEPSDAAHHDHQLQNLCQMLAETIHQHFLSTTDHFPQQEGHRWRLHFIGSIPHLVFLL